MNLTFPTLQPILAKLKSQQTDIASEQKMEQKMLVGKWQQLASDIAYLERALDESKKIEED